MGKRKWTEDYFSKRLRAERERRKWTQTELADQLDAKGIPMHWTTIAKIEKGDRSVRIDEAAGIADLTLHEGKTFHQYTDIWDTKPRYSVASTASKSSSNRESGTNRCAQHSEKVRDPRRSAHRFPVGD
jgi:transcriptional regulator with XRE-family HTH domain